MVEAKDGKQLRYMEPLFVTEDCLKCHEEQGYQLNQLRGGIAVGLSYEPFLAAQRSQINSVVIRYLIFALILVASSSLFTRKSLLDEQKKKSYAVQLEYLSRIDGLTGLLNRRALMDRLDETIESALANKSPLSILLLDLDDFKRINDTYGHLAGDLILKHSAAVIKENVRAVDSVGRYGGDEIMVVLPGLSGALAEKVKERIKRAMSNSPLDYEGVLLYQQVSGGVGTLPEMERDEATNRETLRRLLIQGADKQLYLEKQAKKRGLTGPGK